LERPEKDFRVSPQERSSPFELNVESNLDMRPEVVRRVESADHDRRHQLKSRQIYMNRAFGVLLEDQYLVLLGIANHNRHRTSHAELELENRLPPVHPAFRPEITGEDIIVAGVAEQTAEQLDVRRGDPAS